VLEEMGEARPSFLLVLGAHVIPEVHVHHGKLPVLVENDAKAVFQPIGLELDLGNARGFGLVQRMSSRTLIIPS
jgi:hypothetical protein